MAAPGFVVGITSSTPAYVGPKSALWLPLVLWLELPLQPVFVGPKSALWQPLVWWLELPLQPVFVQLLSFLRWLLLEYLFITSKRLHHSYGYQKGLLISNEKKRKF